MNKHVAASVLLSCVLLLLAGCREQLLDEGIQPFYEPATVDANGGNWRTVVLKSAAEVTVPQPDAITSDAYQRELTEVKNGLLSANPEQNTAVNYWAVGGVIRWNQIARQLVAKYNVAPAYGATGQSLPYDATNPSASQPYAARVLALLSVAQYDALVVAWRAKYQYNRTALARQGLITRVPVLDVPSYPSEDAAIAEASCQVLAYLFPNEVGWLKAKAAEHKQSRIWAGANVASDVKAGENLAMVVASQVINRARNDRFELARDPQNTWSTLLASAPYDVKWTSLDIPARSPILPLAGNTQPWYDATAVAATAPGAPPATTSAAFQQALTEVRDIASKRTREQWRIATFWDDGIGTYGIAGHWNFLAEDYIKQGRQNELRAARTYASMNRAIQDGTSMSWRTKYRYFVPRPSQVDPTIKTATLISNSPSYTAEHATIAAAATTVLTYLFPDQAETLNAQATEATLSQFYSGSHYRFDTEAGAASGSAVGKIAVDWAKLDGAQ